MYGSGCATAVSIRNYVQEGKRKEKREKKENSPSFWANAGYAALG